MMMKKFLLVVFLISAFVVITGSTVLISLHNRESADRINTKVGVSKIAELLEQEEVLVEPEEIKPECLLFGHQFKEGMICFNSHKKYDVRPDNEYTYYEFVYCEHCGYFCIIPVASHRLNFVSES